MPNDPYLFADDKRGYFVDVTVRASYHSMSYEFVGISPLVWLKMVNPVKNTFKHMTGYNCQYNLDFLLEIVRSIFDVEERIERKPSNFPRVIKFDNVRANEVISLKLLHYYDLDKSMRIYLKDISEPDL